MHTVMIHEVYAITRKLYKGSEFNATRKCTLGAKNRKGTIT